MKSCRAVLTSLTLALLLAAPASAHAPAFEYELQVASLRAAQARPHEVRCVHGRRGARGSHPSCRARHVGHRTRKRSAARRALRRTATRPVPHVASRTVSPPQPSTASILAAVLATPCQDTELVPEAANLPLIRGAVLCLINDERAQHGELPLNPDPRLQAAAESHVSDMIANDYFEHVSPDGISPVDRVRAAGYLPNLSVGYVIGENLAWGTYSLATAQSIVAAWIASPGHLANILESSYRDTGIAITPQVPASLANGSPGATYAQEFGVITE